MAYTTNPKMAKVRKNAVYLVKQRGWSTRKVAQYTGYVQSTIVKWCAKDKSGGLHDIPTRSSRPKTSPQALDRKVVKAIIDKRIEIRRCGQVVHQALLRDGIVVSLPSVQRTLNRCGLLKKRSPWKRPHDYTKRPKALYVGALLQCDTIHIRLPRGGTLYVYTLIDLYSRWAYAEAVEKIGAHPSVTFMSHAKKKATFKFNMVQTDNGSEFSKWCTHGWMRLGILHRHGRVRKSNDQAHVERFNRTIQEECLDCTTNTIFNFKKAIPKYLKHYNTKRLHMGINYQTPYEVIPRS